MTRLDTWIAAGDGIVAAVALLLIWVQYVIPWQQPADSALENSLAALDVWSQYFALAVVVLIAAASRRSGSLPIRQLVLLQAAVLTYVVGDVLGDTVPGADRDAVVSYSIIPYCAAICVFLLFASRASLEPETQRSLRLREAWSVGLPVAVLLVALMGALGFRILVGPLPRTVMWALIVVVMALVAVNAVGRWHNEVERRGLAQLQVTLPLEQATRSPWFDALIGDSRDLVTVIDRAGVVVYQTPSVLSLLGFGATEMVGRPFADLFPRRDPHTLAPLLLRASLGAGDRGPHELVLVDARGVQHDTETYIMPLRSGDADGFVLTTRDVTDRRLLRAQLAAAGARDHLTGLSNREVFLARLREEVPIAEPDTLGVLVLDLTAFRDVNDSRGHEVGDHVLRSVAAAMDRLPGTARVVARLAGDEFAALVSASPADPEIGAIDRELRDALRRVVVPNGGMLELDFDLGYAVLADRTTPAAELLEQADLALRAARGSGRHIVRYSATLREGLVSRLRAETDLREALDRGALVVEYQPVVRIGDSTLVGLEALVRLRAPDGSLVPPEQFISRAEDLGLIERIGDLVLDTALRDSCLVRAAAGREITMAVNVSAAQLTPELVSRVGALLRARDVPASALMVELTETALAKNHEEAAAVLSGLRRLGVRVALDDFGTGYSSLAYLAGLPVDELKVDRSFVSQLGTSPTAFTLVRSVVQLAQALDLLTVAEGVETVEQADLLRGMGCELAQGYLFSRPAGIEEILASLVRGGVPSVAVPTSGPRRP